MQMKVPLGPEELRGCSLEPARGARILETANINQRNHSVLLGKQAP